MKNIAKNMTFITTVFNEENSIDKFLESISFQSAFPDEIVIVDSFSTDKTAEKILNFQKKNKKLNIKFFQKKGNIAKGRNFAIEKAGGEIILCSDAGCILEKNWVKTMLSNFGKNVDVVSGFYRPVSHTVFEKCLATYTSVMPDKIDKENFLPSSRSVGFKKSVWGKVGKYPVWLDTCEDLYFARELRRNGYRFKFAEDAVVYWPQRKNFSEAFRQFYNYALGDGTARYIRPATPFLYARYLTGLGLVIFAFATNSSNLIFFILFILVTYIIWSISKNYKYVKKWQALIYLPLLQFTADIAVLLGTTIGLIKSLSVKKLQI